MKRTDRQAPIATECNGCGDCCRKYPIFASKADAEREPRIRAEAFELPERAQGPHRAFEMHRLPAQEQCIFLNQAGRCAIYETRPDVCRNFMPSRKSCREARERIKKGKLGG
jgi:Fe-S-cluster containining protein